MKTIYCTEEYPDNLIVELEGNYNKTVTEHLFKKELQRLIDQAVQAGDNPVHQAIDQLRMADYPTSPQDLVCSMMGEDCIYNLMKEVEGLLLVKAPEEIIEEYQRRTLESFLVEVMPDQNH